MRLASCALAVGALAVAAVLPTPGLTADVREIVLPRSAFPAGIAAAPDGSIWIALMHADRLLRFDPDGGQFTEVPLPAQTLPRGLIVDPQGRLWFAASARGLVGRIAHRGGRPAEFALPSIVPAMSGAPSPWAFAFDPRRQEIWFTVHGEGLVGRVPARAEPVPRGFVVQEVALGPGTRPDGITVDAHGTVWVSAFARDALARIDPADDAIRWVPLPPRSRPRGLTADATGAVWVALAGAGALARVDAATLAMTAWPLPAGGRTSPLAVAADAAGRVWVADYGGNAIMRFVPRFGRFEKFLLSTPGARVQAIAVDRRDRLWYVSAFGGTLGVID